MVSSRMRFSSLALPRKVAENTFCLARICFATSTFSNTVMLFHRRMFWNVRAIPSFVILSGVGETILPVPASESRASICSFVSSAG